MNGFESRIGGGGGEMLSTEIVGRRCEVQSKRERI